MKMLIYGSERYFLEDKARKVIKEKYAFAQGIDPVVYDCERLTFQWEQLFEELMTVSFFESSKVVYLFIPIRIGMLCVLQ
jgi:DNA polymerase III delta subunit